MKKLLLLLLVFTIVCKAQDAVSFGLYHDAKFLITGDKEHDYAAGTAAFTGVFKMAGYQQKYGFMYVQIKANYTALQSRYLRYGFDVGYTFNEWFVNVEPSLAVGAGSINRFGASMLSLQGTASMHYKINDWLRVGVVFKYTQRNDLKFAYGSGGFKPEGDLGIEITL